MMIVITVGEEEVLPRVKISILFKITVLFRIGRWAGVTDRKNIHREKVECNRPDYFFRDWDDGG